MGADDRRRWDDKYGTRAVPDELTVDTWLLEQSHFLPVGRALELACGLGQNAISLAIEGWQVDAVDISPVGLKLAAELASRKSVDVNWTVADLDEFQPAAGAYDLVCVFRFLDRPRLPAAIEAALAPGGTLLYETFTQNHLNRPGSHMRNPDFALAPGELPRLFPGLTVIEYSELELPDRSVARLVARK